MRRGIAWCEKLHPGSPIRIEAQQYLERFYRELGFVTDPAKAPYDDEGIMHIEMVRPPGT
jgi:predicted GNAT family N-acyltransferase